MPQTTIIPSSQDTSEKSSQNNIPPLPDWAAELCPSRSYAQRMWDGSYLHYGHQGAIDYFNMLEKVQSAPIVGSAYPPPESDPLRSFTLGEYQIHFHPSIPKRVRDEHPFSWSFYIGRSGKSPPDGIIPAAEYEKEKISVKLAGIVEGRWQSCNFPVVEPHGRVRLEYTRQGKQITHDVQFPPAPKEQEQITFHRLEYFDGSTFT